MKETPSFHGIMDGDTVCSFVCAVDTYFDLTGIINEQTTHKFASLLLIEQMQQMHKIGMIRRIIPLMLPVKPSKVIFCLGSNLLITAG